MRPSLRFVFQSAPKVGRRRQIPERAPRLQRHRKTNETTSPAENLLEKGRPLENAFLSPGKNPMIPEKERMMFWQKTTLIVGGPVAILLLLVLGWQHDLFHTTAWHDVLMHFLGGGLLILTLAGTTWHLWLKKRPDRLPRLAVFKAGLVAGLLLTLISWEIIEVISDMTPNWTQSVGDTISDMLCALASAAIILHLIRFND